MNCHQILSGACNAGDRCFAVGSVEGVSFTVRNLEVFLCHSSGFYQNLRKRSVWGCVNLIVEYCKVS